MPNSPPATNLHVSPKMSRCSILIVILLLNFSRADALVEAQVCYILDGILFVYGIILTVLYCKLKMRSSSGSIDGFSKSPKKQGHEEGVYTGLTPHAQDTYETINLQKKGNV